MKKYKIAVCIGWVEHNSPSPSPSSSSPSPPYKNISLILNKEGEIILSHTKTHLWDVFENDNFVKGEGLPDCVVLCGLKVSTIICYEGFVVIIVVNIIFILHILFLFFIFYLCSAYILCIIRIYFFYSSIIHIIYIYPIVQWNSLKL